MKLLIGKKWLVIPCLLLLFVAQGCIGKKETVGLMPPIEPDITCSDALYMDASSIPDDNFILLLDRSYGNSGVDTCWKPLMERALKEGRYIPVNHLANAVHVFNRNDGKEEFSAAVYLYFKEIIKGNRPYRNLDKKLMAEYLSFIIQNARTKQDKDLEQARLVCSRLDPEMYKNFFKITP